MGTKEVADMFIRNNIYTVFEKDIEMKYSDMITCLKQRKTKQNQKSALVNDLLCNLGFYTISSYFPFFNDIAPELQNLYIDQLLISFTHYYLKTTLSSSSTETFDKKRFFDGWKVFISTLLNNTQELGPKTDALRNLILDHPVEYGMFDNFKNKGDRFWQAYICREQTPSNDKPTPDLPYHTSIKRDALIFYYILYTIYYYLPQPDEEYPLFPSFKKTFTSYHKYNDINEILSWCISCYYEWYTYDTLHTEKAFPSSNIASYVKGIPIFLDHFGFYWHKGVQWHKHDILDLFDHCDCTFLEDKTEDYISFVLGFLAMHRTHTEQKLTGKEASNKNRKDEKQRLLSAVTSYIQYNLENFFLLPKGELRNHFKKRYTNIDIYEEKKEFLTVEIKEFLSSLFLILTQVEKDNSTLPNKKLSENDLLPYINLHLYFFYLIHVFMQCESYEIIASTEQVLWDDLNNYIDSYHDIEYKKIYNDILMPCFELLPKTYPDLADDLKNQLINLYLSSFDSDIPL